MEKQFLSDTDKAELSKRRNEIFTKKAVIGELYVSWLEFVPGNAKSISIKEQMDKEVLSLSQAEKEFTKYFNELLARYGVDLSSTTRKWNIDFEEMSVVELPNS